MPARPVATGEAVTWTVHLPVRNQVIITVHNGGEPIPANLLPKLTQPFFTTKSSGNGLGLAITKRIIEAHQGDFTITSSAVEGTVATVTLPLIPQTQGILSGTQNSLRGLLYSPVLDELNPVQVQQWSFAFAMGIQ